MPSLEAVEIFRGDPIDPKTGLEDEENESASVTEATMSSEPSSSAEKGTAVPSSTDTARTNTITPNSPDSSSKKQQQRKVSQQTLSSFFFSSNDKHPSQGSASKKSKVRTPNIKRNNASQRSNRLTVSPTEQKTDLKEEDAAARSPTNGTVPESKSESIPIEDSKIDTANSSSEDRNESGNVPSTNEDRQDR